MLKFAILLVPIFFLVSCESYIPQSKEAKEFEERKKELKESIRKTSIDFGLAPLADKTLSNDDLEIRFNRFGSGYIMPAYNDLLVKQSVFILKRTNSEWSANVIRDTFGLNEKRISEQVSPASGWDNLFQQLSDEDILTVSPDQDEEVYSDATFFLIETNIDQRYRFAYSYIPNEASEEKGSKQVAKLFNLVLKEFDATDFQAPTRLFE
ncbi:MAG: hypothetical protein AAB336_13870 [Acidobacteriota bacterium]